MTKFNIGDTVYQARAGQEQVRVTCPECLGSGRLRVILGDNSEVSIACVCCARGYEGSPGRISSYQFKGEATDHLVTGVESRMDGIVQRDRYAFGGYSTDAENVFATREEALTRANTLVQEHEAEEAKRLKYKEKQHKTWASNVAYWRSAIRHAKQDIEQYEARLAVAPKNIKDADHV